MSKPVSRLLPVLALLAVAGCAAPGDGDGAAPAMVEVTPEGDPLIDGERQHPVFLFERLRADHALPAPVIRLPHGVPPDRLLALWSRFAEQLPEATADAMRLELPLASSTDAYRTFPEPPPFVVVAPDGIRVSIGGEVLVPLRSIEELTGAAAYRIAGDPETPFVLVVEAGTEPQRVAEAEERLRRVRVKHLYRLDEAGLHPIDRPSSSP